MIELELFPNPAPHRSYLIKHECLEFTSVCPKTGQPDFGSVEVEYMPGESCIELKSLKLYFQTFRNQGIYYEAVVNRLLDELYAACPCRWMRVSGKFNVRGGFTSVVTAEQGHRPE